MTYIRTCSSAVSRQSENMQYIACFFRMLSFFRSQTSSSCGSTAGHEQFNPSEMQQMKNSLKNATEQIIARSKQETFTMGMFRRFNQLKIKIETVSSFSEKTKRIFSQVSNTPQPRPSPIIETLNCHYLSTGTRTLYGTFSAVIAPKCNSQKKRTFISRLKTEKEFKSTFKINNK